MPSIVLRYFPVVGRAQALRHALTDAGLAWEDLRVPMADWPRLRGEPGFGGPFATLPTLTWDGATVGETLAIASFVARRLGHDRGRDDVAIARLDAITSYCYLEVAATLGQLLWADLLYPGGDVAPAVRMIVGRILDKLGGLDVDAPPTPFWDGERPVVSDYFI